MTAAERRKDDRRRAERRRDLGFPDDLRCPRCDKPNEHVHLCADCRADDLHISIDDRRIADRRVSL